MSHDYFYSPLSGVAPTFCGFERSLANIEKLSFVPLVSRESRESGD